MMYSFENSFNNYYQSVYQRWRILKEKAGKDIVGEEYEKLRKSFYQSFGLTVNKTHDVYGSGINPDNVIVKNGEIIIIEEDKGSYVDGTFLKRALVDAATIFNTCIEKNINCPYFILSSTTKMNNYEEIYDKVVILFNEKLRNELKDKFIYLPLCLNGRVSQKKYFKTEKNHFELSKELLEKQTKTINEIINKSDERFKNNSR
jgi:hypothetical protein